MEKLSEFRQGNLSIRCYLGLKLPSQRRSGSRLLGKTETEKVHAAVWRKWLVEKPEPADFSFAGRHHAMETLIHMTKHSKCSAPSDSSYARTERRRLSYSKKDRKIF